MEHYGANIIGHVIMERQYSTDQTKFKLVTSLKFNNPIKFDILYYSNFLIILSFLLFIIKMINS
jgi:hypothetical protein